MSVVVLCPSRTRPAAASEVALTFRGTAQDPASRLVFLVDSDDPTASEYPPSTLILDPPPGSMNAALNIGANEALARYPEATVFGFIGDDHRFRTGSWDIVLRNFLREHPGIAYGNDLFQQANLPTSWFISRSIVEVFGMGLPGLRHLWIDDYWKTFGDAAGCLYYFPSVIIEHVHPAAGKAPWDEQYLRVNSESMRNHDFAVFEDWRTTSLDADVERLKLLVT